MIEDEKAVRKSPPDSDRNKERYRDVSLSMAPLPIPLGPLGFGGKFKPNMLCDGFSSIVVLTVSLVNTQMCYVKYIFQVRLYKKKFN